MISKRVKHQRQSYGKSLDDFVLNQQFWHTLNEDQKENDCDVILHQS